MSDLKLTPAQQDAVNARGGNVLVSAAAGSGKTAVLVQRIIEALTDKDNPVSIDRMLVVTFTRAATFEMRTRIEKAIDDLLADDPYNKYLLTQKHLLYSARISTIDSFCIEFVRRYFYKLGIQQDFSIPEEGERNILINNAVNNTLEHFYQQNDSEFLNLVSAVCTHRGDDNLKKYITQIYNFLTSLPFPEDYLDEILSYYENGQDGFKASLYYEYIMNYAKDCLLYCLKLVDIALGYLDNERFLEAEKKEEIRDTILDDYKSLDNINAEIMNDNWNGVYDSLNSLKFKKFTSLKNINNNIADTIKSIRDTYKDEVKRLNSVFIMELDEVNSETEKIYPLVKSLFACVKKFIKEYDALKADKNFLTYSDIEHLTVKLLCDKNGDDIIFTDISSEISEEFDLIMVDEFQDINDTQDLIFKAVSNHRDNLFVVGDVKQSIYGFRQAKPEIFIDYKDSYTRYDRDNPSYPAKIILDKNFRSRLGIIEACNFVFSTLMSKELGGIEYNDEEKLSCAASYPENNSPNMELMLIDTEGINKEEDEKKEAFEAARIAEKIQKLVFEEKLQVTDKEGTRNIEYGDIAILLRSAKGDTRRAVTFSNTLAEYMIPVISDEKNNFFEENEIKVILNLLRVIDNPVQDIPLLSVLMSPMFGFTADEMAQIRSANRRVPLYLAVREYCEQSEKCRDFIAFISKMRSLAATISVDRLINIILSETGFDSVYSALNKKPSKNLYLLREYAAKYAGSGYKTLTAFINYVDKMKENGTIINSGDEPGLDNLNAVHIMSVHASKGLEFPVCILSSTSTQFNLKDTSSDLVINSRGGIGLRYVDDMIKHETVQRKAVSLMMTDSRLSEEMRVLYVALTRARERLIITSTQQNPESYIAKLETKIPSYPISPYVLKRFNSFSDWLFTAALANPSCNGLRTNLKPDYYNYSEDYRPWSVSVVGLPPESESDAVLESPQTQNNISKPNPEFIRKFKERLSFEYKNKPLITLPQKVSASELSHKDNKIFNKILRKPEFLEDKKSNGAQRGTAFHSFMEHCDFVRAKSNPKLEAERLVNEGFLPSEELDLLDFNSISELLNGSLITRVINSDEYFREYTFTVKINASDYDENIPTEFKTHKIIMQGAVDLAFIENGEVVIVDYKTDRVKDIEKLGAMYHKQVELYKTALEETMNLKVKEVIIYSVYNNKSIKIGL